MCSSCGPSPLPCYDDERRIAADDTPPLYASPLLRRPTALLPLALLWMRSANHHKESTWAGPTKWCIGWIWPLPSSGQDCRRRRDEGRPRGAFGVGPASCCGGGHVSHPMPASIPSASFYLEREGLSLARATKGAQKMEGRRGRGRSGDAP